MAVKQKDIARQLDLSIGTVSRSLRGHPDIHPETRKRVISLASELGYRPLGYSSNGRHDGADSEKLITFGVGVCWSQETVQNTSSAAYYMLAGISEATARMGISMDT
ncbi:MAG: LacI family DNA-binding transcriptional regulator, partial [Phycisphaerae bacterium]|nr:LacI family DNA-binding transcriptional regulator [Phycisphaerae bacterium]